MKSKGSIPANGILPFYMAESLNCYAEGLYRETLVWIMRT